MAAEHGFNLVEHVVGKDFAGFEGVATAIVVAIILIGTALFGIRRIKKLDNPIVPDDRFTSRAFVEMILLGVLRLADDTMGRENRKYIPFIATIFFYILIGNLIGLVPGMSTPNDSFTFNLGMALTVFVLYHYWGIRTVGIVAYVKEIWGPMFILGFLLFPIELVSHMIRPITLSIRLYANMMADHMVLGTFIDLTWFIVPLIFYLFGTFVCVIQAFIFTLLSMIYIRLATAHPEGHEGSHH